MKIEFFRDPVGESVKISDAVEGLAVLYSEIRGAVELQCIDGDSRSVKFDLDLLLADILKALGCCTYDNLCKIVGHGRAMTCWPVFKQKSDT
jgi:hypothetical protein